MAAVAGAFAVLGLVFVAAESYGAASGASPADQRGRLEHDGLSREYLLHVPKSHPSGKRVPLLMALHGGGGTGENMRKLTAGGFDRLANQEGFIVAYPDGVERHWNDGRDKVKYRTHKEKVDDVGFISALIDKLVRERNADRSRVYVTGMSNGAMMSHRLGVELSDRVAAIAPVTGSLPKTLVAKRPARPVPAMIMYGVADPLMPWEGGEVRLGRVKLGEVLSAEETVRFWTGWNGCARPPAVSLEPDRSPDDGTRVRREAYTPGRGGAEVVLVAVEGGGHAWPGGWAYLGEGFIGRTSRDIDACKVIWDFFKGHSLPPGGSGRASGRRGRGGPAARSYGVKVLEFPDLTDAEREGRRVPVKVLYPEGEGAFPLVVMSHGGVGTWDAHLYQAEHMVRHGYVVLCVEHVFSNNVKAKEHMRSARGTLKERANEALLKITTDPKSVLERPADVSFAIDRAVEWNRNKPELRGRINTRKIGVLGHSFGAYTVLTVCGAQPILDYLEPAVPPGKGLAGDLSDSRVTVGVAMSPQGPGTSRFGAESYKTIKRPLLCFSGSEDEQFGHDGTHQPATKRLEAFRLMPPGGKYFLWLENADHLSFSDNPKAWMLPSKARADAQRIAKTMALAFCDYYLRGDRRAKRRLVAEYADSLRGTVVTGVKWREK